MAIRHTAAAMHHMAVVPVAEGLGARPAVASLAHLSAQLQSVKEQQQSWSKQEGTALEAQAMMSAQ